MSIQKQTSKETARKESIDDILLSKRPTVIAEYAGVPVALGDTISCGIALNIGESIKADLNKYTNEIPVLIITANDARHMIDIPQQIKDSMVGVIIRSDNITNDLSLLRICHLAILSRQLHIPCIIIPSVDITNGASVSIDTNKKTLIIYSNGLREEATETIVDKFNVIDIEVKRALTYYQIKDIDFVQLSEILHKCIEKTQDLNLTGLQKELIDVLADALKPEIMFDIIQFNSTWSKLHISIMENYSKNSEVLDNLERLVRFDWETENNLRL